MRHILTTPICGLAIALCLMPRAGSGGGQSSQKPPETFTANAQVIGQDAGAAGQVTIRIERYTDERDRTKMMEALKAGGYAGFLPVLRQAPQVGYVELNGRKVVARWARQQPTDKGGRTISVVTDAPLFFVGGGAVDAKPRAGFELAIIQLDVDSIGLGNGSMAPAARVKPGGATGVEIDDYAEKPVKLVTVRRSFQ